MKNDKDSKHSPNINNQFLEKEYINCMLNNVCFGSLNDVVIDEPDIPPVTIMSKEQYEKPEIECKVFSVAGLNLALPLLNIRDNLHQQEILSVKKSKQAGMCIGSINFENESIKIVDLRSIIMDGVNNFDLVNDYEGNRADVLLIKGCELGIIYDECIQTQIISNEDVCWRNTSSDRTWLAGTVIKYGLSLLDLEGVVNSLTAEC